MHFIKEIKVFCEWSLECGASTKPNFFHIGFSWSLYSCEGSNLNRISLFLFFRNLSSHHHLVLTCIDDSVFKQGLIQCDTLRGSNFDAQLMPEGICDTRPTLIWTFLCYKYPIFMLLFVSLMAFSHDSWMQGKDNSRGQLTQVPFIVPKFNPSPISLPFWNMSLIPFLIINQLNIMHN